MAVFVAGTFDTLHNGHKALLRQAFKLGENVTIGLTSDIFVQQYKIQIGDIRIQSYDKRKRKLREWLGVYKTKNYTIVPIDDPFEPLASSLEIGTIVVSTETRQRAEQINSMRANRGLAALTIVEVPLVSAQDLRPIRSTRVRRGEITKSGKLVLPDNLRPELTVPMGVVLLGKQVEPTLSALDGKYVITVGDLATHTALAYGIVPQLSVIDQKVGRKPYRNAYRELADLAVPMRTLRTGPGYISEEAMRVMRQTLKSLRLQRTRTFQEMQHTRNIHEAQEAGIQKPRHDSGNQRIKIDQKIALVIDGEEDLLALPAIAFSPVGAIVLYGQPDMGRGASGLVYVKVTAERRKKALTFLRRFVVS